MDINKIEATFNYTMLFQDTLDQHAAESILLSPNSEMTEASNCFCRTTDPSSC